MQVFGKFETNYDEEYLTEQYLYMQEEDETITVEDLNAKLKKKRKHVIGTIYLYNPLMSPKGFNNKTPLRAQGYEFDGEFKELNFDNACNLFGSAIKDGYRGKLIEVKYLFRLNKADIQPTSALEYFDADLDRLYSEQFTMFDKELCYQDYKNLSISGKFVFFGWGHKFDRHHHKIYAYAQHITAKVEELGKEIAYIHDRNFEKDDAKRVAYFMEPLALGKNKTVLSGAFKNAFKTCPPTTQRLM
ncbi:MAG: hypothetical protein GQ570_11480 [Helicobacteraceae bacterium]|nr:hypothetical protein [Helicobacteraceae bacterium]